MRVFATLAAVLCLAGTASAQQVTIGTPMQNLNDSFYENFNIGWGFSKAGRGGNFFFNGPGPALPPFGGHDPNGDARLGVGFRGNGGSGFFNLTAGQGRSSTLSHQTPFVTVPNGYGGSVSDTSIRPFVTGFTPVVGMGGPMMAPPVYQSPLGASQEEIYRNIQQIRAKQDQEAAKEARSTKQSDADALAAERARLKTLRSQKSNDDPPLRLIGQ